MLDNLLQQESLPRGADLGMAFEVALGRQIDQRMEDAGIGDIDFGVPDLPLGEVGGPGWQDPNHQGVGQQVEVPAHAGVTDPERPAEFRGIEHLAMVVGQHVPEAAKHLDGHIAT